MTKWEKGGNKNEINKTWWFKSDYLYYQWIAPFLHNLSDFSCQGFDMKCTSEDFSVLVELYQIRSGYCKRWNSKIKIRIITLILIISSRVIVKLKILIVWVVNIFQSGSSHVCSTVVTQGATGSNSSFLRTSSTGCYILPIFLSVKIFYWVWMVSVRIF